MTLNEWIKKPSNFVGDVDGLITDLPIYEFEITFQVKSVKHSILMFGNWIEAVIDNFTKQLYSNNLLDDVKLIDIKQIREI